MIIKLIRSELIVYVAGLFNPFAGLRRRVFFAEHSPDLALLVKKKLVFIPKEWMEGPTDSWAKYVPQPLDFERTVATHTQPVYDLLAAHRG